MPVLERIDPLTGETTGQWTWPDNTIDDTMSHSYRFFITGGYVHDKPVLVTAQEPTETCICRAMARGWKKCVGYQDPLCDGGARSSHLCPVLDFNDDGVDELFWGERLDQPGGRT